jgi:hypothetical protein
MKKAKNILLRKGALSTASSSPSPVQNSSHKEDVPVEKFLGALLKPLLGSKVSRKQETSKKPVNKGLLGAGLGAIAGAPLGPIGMAAGGALGSKISSKQSKEPVQKFIGAIPAAIGGALGGKLLGLQEEERVPVQKILGGLLGTIGMGGKQEEEEEEPVQKFIGAIPAAAIGAIGGKLLGLSKKEGVPLEKIIPLLPLAGALAGPAAGAVGKKLMGKQEKKPVQKIIGAAAKLAGPAIGRALGAGAKAAKPQIAQAGKTALNTAATTAGTEVGMAAGKKVSGAINPTKSSLEKHRGKAFHSHKRKNPFSTRRR